MKFMNLLSYIFLFVLCIGSTSIVAQNSKSNPIFKVKKELKTTKNPLLQLNGTQLVDSDQNPVYLQGIAFNNFIWNNTPIPQEHHSEIDFQRVATMGMNTIRFYMNYRFFEDDTNPYTYKQTGWDWLDRNIAWAKKNNIYLVLNMHAPQGGYQSQGKGNALWDNIENQNRLAALWKAIAKRYKNEVQIAGFGPVNEPVPTQSMKQWNILAQRLINDIREVNKNHLLFIERAIYIQENYTKDKNFNFPEVTGENLIYEFHGYSPHRYTHQILDFTKQGDGGKYPDETIIEATNSEWYTTTFDNPSLPKGTTDWAYYEGVKYAINDKEIALGKITLAGSNINGRVYFDDLMVREFNQKGDFVRNIYQANLNTISGWNFWSQNGSGSTGISSTQGHKDSKSIFIEGTTADSNLSFYEGRFEPKQGYSYQISGWMKGENNTNDFVGKFRLDFQKVNGPIYKRNKDFLDSYLSRITDWAKSKNAALYMGEFGAGTPCFKNDKGGLIWVSDMVDLLKKRNIHFSYHSYHESAFGLYYGSGLPDPKNVNQPLVDWFTNNLN